MPSLTSLMLRTWSSCGFVGKLQKKRSLVSGFPFQVVEESWGGGKTGEQTPPCTPTWLSERSTAFVVSSPHYHSPLIVLLQTSFPDRLEFCNAQMHDGSAPESFARGYWLGVAPHPSDFNLGCRSRVACDTRTTPTILAQADTGAAAVTAAESSALRVGRSMAPSAAVSHFDIADDVSQRFAHWSTRTLTPTRTLKFVRPPCMSGKPL
jgi:hypothetical protein